MIKFQLLDTIIYILYLRTVHDLRSEILTWKFEFKINTVQISKRNDHSLIYDVSIKIFVNPELNNWCFGEI